MAGNLVDQLVESNYLEPPFWQQASGLYNQYMPSYNTLQGGLLGSQYLLRPEELKSASAWERNMLEKQAIEQQRMKEQAQAQGASGFATARSGMAMRGGLDTGARERLARDYARQQMMSGQDIAGRGMEARLGVQAQAADKLSEQERFNLMNRQMVSQWNLQRAQEERAREQELAQRRYETEMQGRASERQAQATERSGKKGIFG